VAAPAPAPVGDSRRQLITLALIFAAVAVLGVLAFLLRGGDAARPIAAPPRTTATDQAASGTAGSGTAGPRTSAAGSSAAGSSASGAAAGNSASGAATSGGTTTRPVVTSATASQAGSATAGGAGQATAPGAAGTGAAAESKPGSSAVVLVPTPDMSGIASTPATGAGASASTPAGATGSTPASGGAAQPGSASAAAVPPPTTAPSTARQPTPQPAAAGSTRLPVTWRVVGDPSGRWNLDEQGRVAGRTETGASMVLFPESVDDVGFSASVSTTTCQASLVFRAQDDENLLMAIYIPDGLPSPGTAGGGVWLYQRVEGLDLPIRAVRPSTVRPAGEPVRMKIVTSGPQIAIYLNDEPALQAVDTAPRAGKLGLMVYSTSGRLCDATFGDIER
jgi:hypothetical protein